MSRRPAPARLLEPSARVLPSRAVTRAALVRGTELGHMAGGEQVLGVDVSAFNTRAAATLAIWQRFDRPSEPTVRLRFDFKARRPFRARRAVTLTATRAGQSEGVLQWLRLELDDAFD